MPKLNDIGDETKYFCNIIISFKIFIILSGPKRRNDLQAMTVDKKALVMIFENNVIYY